MIVLCLSTMADATATFQSGCQPRSARAPRACSLVKCGSARYRLLASVMWAQRHCSELSLIADMDEPLAIDIFIVAAIIIINKRIKIIIHHPSAIIIQHQPIIIIIIIIVIVIAIAIVILIVGRWVLTRPAVLRVVSGCGSSRITSGDPQLCWTGPLGYPWVGPATRASPRSAQAWWARAQGHTAAAGGWGTPGRSRQGTPPHLNSPLQSGNRSKQGLRGRSGAAPVGPPTPTG